MINLDGSKSLEHLEDACQKLSPEKFRQSFLSNENHLHFYDQRYISLRYQTYVWHYVTKTD